jgi:hypothetical protein
VSLCCASSRNGGGLGRFVGGPRRRGSQKLEAEPEFVCGEVHERRVWLTVSGAHFFLPATSQPPRSALKKKRRLAGRSASRRMRYGYHADPKGT